MLINWYPNGYRGTTCIQNYNNQVKIYIKVYSCFKQLFVMEFKKTIPVL